MDFALTITFWLAAGLLAYTFLGYPAAVHLLGRFRAARQPPAARPHEASLDTPVSVVMVARNEAQRIAERVANLLETGHRGPLEVVVVSDGSTDDTAARIGGLGNPQVRLIERREHRGKAACLNDGVAAARGAVVVFADARQQFEPATISALVAAFADPAVGAVSGELRIGASAGGVAAGVDAYWRLEKAIRLGESRIDSAIGCTGAVYAIRRELFEPLPADTILDDVVCPMRIALRGRRVRFCPAAAAFDPQRLDPRLERRRKRRTLAGNFQMLFRHPGWLLPWRNRLFVQLVSHKYLRLVGPLLLVALLASGAALAGRGSPLFLAATIGQAGFYLLAVAGMLLPRAAGRCFSFPAAFLFLNLMTALGFLDYCSRRTKTGW